MFFSLVLFPCAISGCFLHVNFLWPRDHNALILDVIKLSFVVTPDKDPSLYIQIIILSSEQ